MGVEVSLKCGALSKKIVRFGTKYLCEERSFFLFIAMKLGFRSCHYTINVVFGSICGREGLFDLVLRDRF